MTILTILGGAGLILVGYVIGYVFGHSDGERSGRFDPDCPDCRHYMETCDGCMADKREGV